MPKPASIGDEEKDAYKLISETFPWPKGGRKELLRGIEQIINGGGVQKFVVAVGQPIRVTRAVKDNGEIELPQDVVEDDIMSAVRNAEMREELALPDSDPLDYLFQAFLTLRNTRVEEATLQPKVFVVKRLQQVRQWLDKPDMPAEMFGIDIIEHKDVPDDALLFVAALANDIDVVKFTLKLVMDMPWRASS
jgi:hypothetical protein